MSKRDNAIRVLSESLINKIAAGEVIERPASVVKELVENAIDAGARHITVIVKKGGKELIQVIDDGSGMTEQDAIMSLQRHATSKIQSLRDIEQIASLGFRGEALASIASVSRLELNTVLRDSIDGTALRIEGGTVNHVGSTGGNAGSSIAIKNLFYNTPARRKFLRADSTEYRYILHFLNRFTLAFPHISFTLFNDDKKVFQYHQQSLKQRIAAVLGSRVQNNLIEVDDKNALMHIHGFVGNNDVMRKSRNDQYIFLNQRYIEDRTVGYAVQSAFGETIPKGVFPLYVLFLDIDPGRVDVNVHPTKTQVKFADQNMIYSLVRSAVSRALVSDQIVPGFEAQNHSEEQAFSSRFQAPLLDEMRTWSRQQAAKVPSSSSEQISLALTNDQTNEDAFQAAAGSYQSNEPEGGAMVWQLHNKYILSQIKSGLVVIDQHDAHERILYERAKKNFAEKTAASQQMLFPQTLDLSAEDYENLMEILPLLQKIGFVIKGFGGHTIVVEGIPSGLKVGSESKILLNILDEYSRNKGSEVDIQERVAKSFACRSAIMTGEKLNAAAMNALIDQLFTTHNPYFCPHGRPTMVTITIDELDKRFERK
ncbi:DNA mismatch repair endonuclease MutL [candidate division KSB1 bacterium]|nr:DNA mismatch repair endonuclease MutL [candidate division KSB1 bacterium]